MAHYYYYDDDGYSGPPRSAAADDAAAVCESCASEDDASDDEDDDEDDDDEVDAMAESDDMTSALVPSSSSSSFLPDVDLDSVYILITDLTMDESMEAAATGARRTGEMTMRERDRDRDDRRRREAGNFTGHVFKSSAPRSHRLVSRTRHRLLRVRQDGCTQLARLPRLLFVELARE